MNLIENKICIINACVGGGWYPAGSKRLAKSLNFVGFAGDLLSWINEWPNNKFDKDCNYNVKPSAFTEAIKKGYSHILWCDSSVWALNDPMPVFDIINDKGYFFWNSGYNCAQVCNDNSLNYFNKTRDEVENWPDISSGIIGVNLKSQIGRKFISLWLKAARNGIFKGSRFHDNQSSDPRFLFHRQDQSAASLIAGEMGLAPLDVSNILGYFKPNMPENWIFSLRGI